MLSALKKYEKDISNQVAVITEARWFLCSMCVNYRLGTRDSHSKRIDQEYASLDDANGIKACGNSTEAMDPMYILSLWIPVVINLDLEVSVPHQQEFLLDWISGVLVHAAAELISYAACHSV